MIETSHIENLYNYIRKIREANRVDVHTIVNTTLILNPYITKFPQDFILGDLKKSHIFTSFIFNLCKYYIFNCIRILTYLQILLHFKNSYKKKRKRISKNDIIIDVYVNVNSVVENKILADQYFPGLHSIMRAEKCHLIIMPRLIGVSHNPIRAFWQLRDFFRIINKDDNNYLFEFEFLSVKSFIKIIWFYICYPFKTLRLLRPNQTGYDKLFNFHLVKDISRQSIISFTRYILGENIAKAGDISEIFSWSEFQVSERAFNYGVRKYSKIKIHACQFLIGYPTHFHMQVHDIDEIQRSGPTTVLVNGNHYLLERRRVDYQLGVSLRYKNIFKNPPYVNGTQTVILGSYSESETAQVLKLSNRLKNTLFKGHPLVNNVRYSNIISKNTSVTEKNIYDLFPQANIVIGSASGALVEAIACGISVLIVAREDRLPTNPMALKGKGKMWDIAYTTTEVEMKREELIKFRSQNKREIVAISSWYRRNLFVEPTNTKIKQTFGLN